MWSEALAAACVVQKGMRAVRLRQADLKNGFTPRDVCAVRRRTLLRGEGMRAPCEGLDDLRCVGFRGRFFGVFRAGGAGFVEAEVAVFVLLPATTPAGLVAAKFGDHGR